MNLVTGATGLVGSWLLLELSKRGKPVRAMKRIGSSVEPVKNLFLEFLDLEHFEKIEWTDADLLDLASLSNAVKGVETIYHTAAKVGFDPRYRKKIYRTNVYGTENLINTAAEMSVSNFLFVSSISTLDAEIGSQTIDENSKWNPELPHSDYAISKRRAEMEVYRTSEETGMNICIVNPSVIIGSLNSRRSSESLFERAFRKSGLTTDGITGFVDVRDVAFCLAELAEKEIWNQKFILNAEDLKFSEVFDLIRKKHNLKKMTVLSNAQLKLIKNLSKLSLMFGGPGITNAAYSALTGKSNYSNRKIMDVLDFKFISVKDSIEFHSERYLRLKSKNSN